MLEDFLLNVRTAARLLAPTVDADSVAANPHWIEQGLATAAIWLTPRTVEQFDPDDFDFLSDGERDQLSEAVEQFRSIAGQVPPDDPALPTQQQEARQAFERILEIIAPRRYADPQALRLGKQLERRLADRLPHAVAELRFRTGTDVGGDPGLWISVVLRDEYAPKELLLEAARPVRKMLETEVRRLGTGYWPYVRFVTESELRPEALRA